MPLKEFNQIINELQNDAFEVVTNFAFGLVNLQSITTVQQDVNYIFCKLKANIDEKAVGLKKLATEVVSQSLSEEGESSLFLRACDWIYELHDDQFTKSLTLSSSQIKIKHSEFQIGHNTSFPYFLQHRTHELWLSIGHPFELSSSIIVPFIEKMPNILKNKNVKIRSIDIMRNPYIQKAFSSLCQCLQHIESLKLVSCCVTGTQATELSEKVQHLSKPIKHVNLNSNQFDSEAAIAVSKCLHNIEELHLQNCGIPTNGIKSLADAVKILPKQMKLLHLGDTQLDDDSAIALSLCLHNIEALILENCNIPTNGITSLSVAIKMLPKQMKLLYLGRNQLDDEGVTAISLCLHNIQALFLDFCNITTDGIKSISNVISILPKQMKFLHLGDNQLDEDGVISVSSCIHNIEQLILENCNITTYGIIKLSVEIKMLSKQMKVLSLSGNQLDDDGWAAISSCLHNIEELNLSDCNITTEGIKSLSCAIRILPKQMKLLDVGDNLVNDDVAAALSLCLHNIEELRLCNCNITNDGIKSLTNAISILPKQNRCLVKGLEEQRFEDQNSGDQESQDQKFRRSRIERSWVGRLTFGRSWFGRLLTSLFPQ